MEYNRSEKSLYELTGEKAMLSKVYSSGVIGIEGFEVAVECSAWDRVPAFELVGLPDAAVKESKNRVRAACENSGFVFPPLDIMVNLAPADVKKEGSMLDLAIIASILQSPISALSASCRFRARCARCRVYYLW